MTNEELIAKIKAEIERLLDEAPTCDDTIAYLMKVECFLDTLESEKPVPNDLEEAAREFAKDAYPDKHNLVWMFKRGAKWQEKQMLKEAIHYVVQDDLDSHGASYNIPFIRLGTVALKPKGIGVGDKVRVIIVKEDEK